MSTTNQNNTNNVPETQGIQSVAKTSNQKRSQAGFFLGLVGLAFCSSF